MRACKNIQWPGWEVVIGLEVHARIKSRAKLFSYSWSPEDTNDVNSHVHSFDAAFPGTLPKLNHSCLELALKTAFILDSRIQLTSYFDRKHYFYADSPAGYQITQHYAPLAKGGNFTLKSSGKTIRIKQIQLEQDTAKSSSTANSSDVLIDLNRAGCGLMEIVTEPDMRTPEEAGDFLHSLQALLRNVGSCDGNMQQGSLRCDANISVNPVGASVGTRTEIKNLNSIRFMIKALAFEAHRHIALLQSRESVPQETRGFDESTMRTYRLRDKEVSPDYRFMPDPNISPIRLTQTYLDNLRKSMPRLLETEHTRLKEMGLTEMHVEKLLTLNLERAIGFDGNPVKGPLWLFDQVVQKRNPKAVVNWIFNFYGFVSQRKDSFCDSPTLAGQLGELIDMVQSGRMTATAGRTLLRYLVETETKDSPGTIAQKLSLLSIDADDDKLTRKLCTDVIISMPEEAAAVRNGNQKVLNKMIGYVMKASRGTADAIAVKNILEKELSST